MNWCKICGYAWHKRKEKRTRQCPSCLSSNWDGTKELRRVYDFGSIAVGEQRLYEWEDNQNRNFIIIRALISYSRRTNRKFKTDSKPLGLLVTRLI